MSGFLSSSHHLTEAQTLRDSCPAKTNGDSLNPRLQRPNGAINNMGPSRLPEPRPTDSLTHPDKAERQEGCLLLKKKKLVGSQNRQQAGTHCAHFLH